MRVQLILLSGLFCLLLPLTTLATEGVDPNSPDNFYSQKVGFDPHLEMQFQGLSGPDLLELGKTDPVTATYLIIQVILSLLGTGFLVLLLYAGWLWLTARGNEEQITKAKQIIMQAVIGFIIIFISLAAARLVYSYVNGDFTL